MCVIVLAARTIANAVKLLREPGICEDLRCVQYTAGQIQGPALRSVHSWTNTSYINRSR